MYSNRSARDDKWVLSFFVSLCKVSLCHGFAVLLSCLQFFVSFSETKSFSCQKLVGSASKSLVGSENASSVQLSYSYFLHVSRHILLNYYIELPCNPWDAQENRKSKLVLELFVYKFIKIYLTDFCFVS